MYVLPLFQWGERLHGEQEEYLVAQNGHVPVFVTHFPTGSMPFYARPTDGNPDTVSPWQVPGLCKGPPQSVLRPIPSLCKGPLPHRWTQWTYWPRSVGR